MTRPLPKTRRPVVSGGDRDHVNNATCITQEL